jgi:hypothetical protein
MQPFLLVQHVERAPAVVLIAVLAGCSSGNASNNDRADPTPSAAVQPQRAEAPVKPAVPALPPVAEQISLDDFAAYWPEFREAVASGDRDKIAALTRFPFETRGDSDDDAVRKLGREEFLRALDSMLNEDPGLLVDGKETQRQYIARSAKLNARDYTSGDESAHVGVFLFEKHGNRWWFTRAYVSDDD